MGGGGGVGIQSVPVTATATETNYPLGFKTTEILMRTLATNTDNITIKLGTYEMLGGSITIRPGEFIAIDITQILQLKVLMGKTLGDEDFITKLTITGAASSPVVWIDALGV